ncbi:glutamate--tRNA ligase [Kingella negevensis]|uniref:Glutamate--tRNA ligase n=1 Tax=Kingella negevensis TaxID=1522312 RepID=A0A238TDX3_9NEIS|nr:glutamate--tRNA ligase [Kingella negevensis]MDK4684244.1 glutamate--tRNA ligase [Kingella negevensis]MDK4698150.1 glutamate--tRNA ligase [Kingella negevensis]MDK4707211.1 glutamate--tRNA ligase [Kingella negevensis]MDK4710789.1 glutamate--tRNA ligase [Kingella negevensis]SNB70510.1 Glutamate--tRNA ligase [Kingella negevensis]
MTVKTRFAPSPTGYLHIGGVRTALYSWAFAKHHGGDFLLRIEDTDLERSTKESVEVILKGMEWVGLDAKNSDNIVYQTQNFPRYKELIKQLVEQGHAYPCYCSKEELAQMRERAEREGTATYDRRWRPEAGKTLPEIPAGVEPVIRFKNPLDGVTVWNDLVKGEISIPNSALDDLIIARADGTPTYNFCVVVDDFDMGITHVIRGDDHVNNTPKQINIFKALGAKIPEYAHLPMILNEQGKKISKRSGDTVAITEYEDMGILPEALLNYLARLGWAHGDDEFFTMNQFVEWFELAHVSASPSRMDSKKLLWINAEHIKATDNEKLAELTLPRLQKQGITVSGSLKLSDVIALVKDRAQDLNALATECAYFYQKAIPAEADVAKHWDEEAPARMQRFAEKLAALDTWTAESIHDLFKPFCDEEGIKMGKLGMPLRLAVCGTAKTPSVDAVLALMGKEEVLKRMRG